MKNRVIIAILCGFICIDIALCYLVLTITPLKLKRNVFTYQYGEKISSNVEDYVIANASVIESLKLNIKNVSTEVGQYKASISYFNKEYPFEIHIVDTIKPKAQLKQVQWNILIGEKIYAKNLVTKVEDSSATTIYFLDEKTGEKKESISFNQEGSYIERIVVEDVHGNQSAALRVKIVVGKNDVKPVIEGANDVFIQMGENIDLSEGVKAIDDEEGDITSKMKIIGAVDVNKPGDYRITYVVEDSDGNVSKVVRIITVE